MAPPSAKREKAAQKAQQVMRFRLDGASYELDAGQLSPRIERELFTQAGLTMRQLGDAMQSGASFCVPAMVFLARRQRGDVVQYQPIEDAIWEASQKGEIELELLTDGGDDAGPPVRAAS